MEMRDGGPGGTPLGRALDIPAGIAYDELREVVAAIDRVHGDGRITAIPLRIGSGIDDLGRFRYDEMTGEPISIVIRSRQAFPQLTTAHEIGHLLDWVSLGSDLTFGSAVNPRLLLWLDAVVASRAYRELHDLERRGVASVVDISGLASVVRLTVREREAIRICLLPEECWARSYAQYVAMRSNHRGLVRGIEGFRSHEPGKVYYPLHWDEDDFAPIEAAIERLFLALGWRR